MCGFDEKIISEMSHHLLDAHGLVARLSVLRH